MVFSSEIIASMRLTTVESQGEAAGGSLEGLGPITRLAGIVKSLEVFGMREEEKTPRFRVATFLITSES